MNQTDKVKLSISIVHHDGLDKLKRCLSSVYTHKPPFEFEVIVVNNASTDGAVDFVKTKFPQVLLVENTMVHGFGHNQNLGIQRSSGEFVFILNDDTELHTKTLEKLIQYLDQHPDVGVVGPKLLNPDGSVQVSCFKFPTPFQYVWESFLLSDTFPNSTLFGDYRAWAHDTERDVDVVVGAAMMVRRQVIDTIGLFDERFFMYYEETDWQLRMKNAGLKRVFFPAATLTHLGGKSYLDADDKLFTEFQRSSFKYTQKHFGAAGVLVQQLAIVFGAWIRIGAWTILGAVATKHRDESRRRIYKWTRMLKWWIRPELEPQHGQLEAVPDVSLRH